MTTEMQSSDTLRHARSSSRATSFPFHRASKIAVPSHTTISIRKKGCRQALFRGFDASRHGKSVHVQVANFSFHCIGGPKEEERENAEKNKPLTGRRPHLRLQSLIPRLPILVLPNRHALDHVWGIKPPIYSIARRILHRVRREPLGFLDPPCLLHRVLEVYGRDDGDFAVALEPEVFAEQLRLALSAFTGGFIRCPEFHSLL